MRDFFGSHVSRSSISRKFDYMSDGEIMNKLYKREIQEVIIGRSLTSEESDALTRIDSTRPREHLMAKDALSWTERNLQPKIKNAGTTVLQRTAEVE